MTLNIAFMQRNHTPELTPTEVPDPARPQARCRRGACTVASSRYSRGRGACGRIRSPSHGRSSCRIRGGPDTAPDPAAGRPGLGDGNMSGSGCQLSTAFPPATGRSDPPFESRLPDRAARPASGRSGSGGVSRFCGRSCAPASLGTSSRSRWDAAAIDFNSPAPSHFREGGFSPARVNSWSCLSAVPDARLSKSQPSWGWLRPAWRARAAFPAGVK